MVCAQGGTARELYKRFFYFQHILISIINKRGRKICECNWF